ncbi:Oidioi.mRNA.OKI2018_I69.chr1.g2946.t1.cds [Oikopleura dioica]|uniref:Trifunctional enzyme subunit beta, mitochondrial n=1 Tax=Oikopleura dioica TaxID=34765 RepID=A0ABN7SZH9_OIKDI|nr:Oidioi.mRNA.OKI2018_I69.chr1.g2946.t1.cds [Oikopleura dioica]
MLRNGLRASQRHLQSGLADNTVVVLDSCRTPFTKSSTAYSNLMPHDMLRAAVSQTIQRSGIDGNEIDYAVGGTVIAEVKTSNVMREACLGAGLPQSLPAHTVTMACISSSQAVTTGIGHIMSGAGEVVICGGVETMSDVPIRHAKAMRQHLLRNQRMLSKGPKGVINFLKPVFKAPGKFLAPEPPAISEFSTGEIMGHSADRLASAWGVSRADQDAFAIRSHTNAFKASEAGLLSDVFEYHIPGGETISKDNGIQVNTPEKLAGLRAAFVKPHGTVTAGNSSYLTDGASACILSSHKKAQEMGLGGKAILRDYMYVAIDPKDQLLLGPAYGIARLLERSGLKPSDIDVWEIHEAFAGQVLANLEALKDDKFCRERMGVKGAVGELPMDKLNNWGGSLSMGHPFGATGIRLVSHCANRLKHEDGQYAMIAACAAGGHAFAGIVERHPDY